MVLLDLREAQWSEESTAGTENSTYLAYPLRITSLKAAPENEMLNLQTLESRNEAELLFHGKETFPFEVKGAIQSWEFMYWFMGAVSTTGTDPYTHALTLANSIPSLSKEFVYGDGDFSLKFLGSKIDTFDLSFVTGEIPQVTLTGFALEGEVVTSPGTPSQQSTTPYEWHQTSTLDINSVSYLSGQSAVCERAQYQGANNIASDYGLDSRLPSEINEGSGRNLAATYDIRVNDETIHELRDNYTDFAISHIITRDTNDTFTFTISNAKTNKPEPASEGGGGAFKYTLPAKVISDWTATAVDSKSTYSNPA